MVHTAFFPKTFLKPFSFFSDSSTDSTLDLISPSGHTTLKNINNPKGYCEKQRENKLTDNRTNSSCSLLPFGSAARLPDRRNHNGGMLRFERSVHFYNKRF